MARETISELKNKIILLEETIEALRDLNNLFEALVKKLKDERNDILKNNNVVSIDRYNALLNDIEKYKLYTEQYKNLYKGEKEINAELRNHIHEVTHEENYTIQKLKNERGAGRKSKINNELIENVQRLRIDGKSFTYISKELNISIGLAHKVSKL